MAIKKQEFYEGAALHLLARTGSVLSVRYEQPFFLLNERFWIMLKYSTRNRSPWGFTFTESEQLSLQEKAAQSNLILGLICGADGVAAIDYEAYLSLAKSKTTAVHIACYRKHGEHYEVNGPDGVLKKKIAPSAWQRIFAG